MILPVLILFPTSSLGKCLLWAFLSHPRCHVVFSELTARVEGESVDGDLYRETDLSFARK